MTKRQFTISHFVQNINIDLLEAYFNQANLPFPNNLKTTDKDKKPNAQDIETLINSLETKAQEKINNDFIDINELSYDGGILSIIDVGNVYNINLTEELSSLEDNTNQALYCFLNHKGVFENASKIAYFERLSSKTVRNDMVKKTAQEVSNEEVKNALETELKTYFKQKDGRGENCKIDVTIYKNRVFYRAYPQNYSQFLFDYDEEGKYRRSVVKPVFEVIFIYYPDDGRLELSVNFRNKRRRELIEIFSRIVLKDDRTIKDELQTYDFDRIVSPDFTMPTKLEDKVSWAYLKQLRLSYRYTTARKITLEVDDKNTDGAKAIHEMIKEYGLNTEQLFVTQATFKIKFEGAGNKGSVTAMITYPDKCNLSDIATHQLAKDYIKYWKLELSDNEGNN